MAPGTEVKPPRMTTGSALSATSCSENCTPSFEPQMMPGHQGHEAGDRPDDHPDAVERDADRLRGLVVVGHRAQRPPRARLLEEERQGRHQHGGDHRGDHVLHADEDAALEDALQEDLRLLGHADVERVDVAAPDRLAEPVEEVGDARAWP